MVGGRDVVRQSLLLLLTTVPGERVMRPTYGCHLHRLVFWPNDDTTAGLAIHYVRDAVERFELRAQIVGVDASRNPDLPERLDLVLAYRVRPTGQLDELAVSIDLQAGT
jgi:phage baseplate assembly protein W